MTSILERALLEKTETFDDDSNILMNHFIRSLISRESPIIKKDAFYKQLGVGLDAKWMHSICDHDLIFESTECGSLRVVDRLVLELGVVEPDMMVKLWNTKHGDKSELEYLVENRKMHKLYDHHRVYTSGFKVEYRSNLLGRVWLKFDKNTKMEEVEDFKNSDDSCFDRTAYLINGSVFSIDAPFWSECVLHQSCRNSMLFGSREIDICVQDGSRYENIRERTISAIPSVVKKVTNDYRM